MSKKINILLSLFACFTWFFFAPIEIYFSIYEEVWFEIGHMIGLVILCFLAGGIGCFCLLSVINKISGKWYCRMSLLLFGIVLSSYIQGNFLRSSFGSMDGEVIAWSDYGIEAVISVLVWIVIIGGCFVLFKKVGGEKFWSGAKVVMICILLVQLVTLGTVCLTTDGLKSKSSAAFIDRNEFVYSSNKNVVILLLDMYDSRVFQAICDEPENKKNTEMLDGFTFYPDTVGAYSLTYCAVPHILTGEKYRREQNIEEYLNDAYVKSPLISKLQKEDYSINLYTHVAVPTEKEAYEMIANYLPEEESHTSISSKRRFITYLGKLIGIRYLPQPLKKFCWFYSEELLELRDVDYEENIVTTDNFIFYDGIKEVEVTTTENMFHFYHIDGMHMPCYYDENMQRTDKNLALDGYDGLIRNGKGMMVLVESFIEKLKQEGVYDNTAIVIMADHGGRYYAGEQDEDVSRANPLLLIKGFNEKHDLQVSQKAVSYDDLQDVFGRLIDGMQGNDILKDISDEKRERYFMNASDFSRYYTEGQAADIQSYKRVE